MLGAVKVERYYADLQGDLMMWLNGGSLACEKGKQFLDGSQFKPT